MIKLQKSGVFCKNILHHKVSSKFENYFQKAMAVLHKKVADFNSVFSACSCTTNSHKIFTTCITQLTRIYWSHEIIPFPNWSYNSKGMRWKLHRYVRSCHKCQIMILQKPKFIDLYQDIAQTPQDHSSIDLLEPYKATSQGNLYILTAVCNLTGYIMTTPIKDKKYNVSSKPFIFWHYVEIWFS